MDTGPHHVLETMLDDQTAEPTDLPLLLLQQITDGFSDDQRIGTGGFAVVYKGILQNGAAVAVKKLSRTYDMDEKKFNQEIESLMKTKHKNVVRFLGYCADTQGKGMEYQGKFVMADFRSRLLCFEYLPNGSLDRYITDASQGLEWMNRYQIIKGIAQGLHYLHNTRILHLDLKPANILLDATMTPKIADFGLSRCFGENQTWTVTSKLVGSVGYIAPESFDNNFNIQITFKSDIYSFGVITMEILTGKRGYSPIEDVVESWKNRLELHTPQVEQVRVCTEIGIQCINSDPAKRPSTRHIIDRLDHSSIQIGTSTATGSSPAPHQTKVAKIAPRIIQKEEGRGWLSSLFNTYNILRRPPEAISSTTAEIGGEEHARNELVHFEGSLAFTADDLLSATAEAMGKSTYGTVYRATLKDGSLVVAVKRLREKITKGPKEFEAEAAALAKLRHPNLLALRAYYCSKDEKLLVFDNMPKGSLSAFLHDRAPNTLPVDWATRMTIAKGTARGLAYLHDHMGIVHGNLTSRNVLFDADRCNPKIAEFGLFRLMTDEANSNVLAATGARGYRAPELSNLEEASGKTDVYSLGVIVLELLTGMKLPQWVRSIAKDGRNEKLFDLELMRDAAAGGPEGDKLMDTLKLALQCVQASPAARPEAREVLRQLEQIRPGPPEEEGGGAGPSDAAPLDTV